jgi:hypothetical protein
MECTMSWPPALMEMESHNAVACSPLWPPFALVTLIVCCALILSVARGCDPTKEPPTPEIMTSLQ